MASGKFKRFLRKIAKRYKLIVYDEQRLKKLFHIHASILRTGIYVFILFILLISLIYYSINTMFVKKLVYGTQVEDNEIIIAESMLTIDSLLYEIKLKDKFIYNIRNIIRGEEPLTMEEFLEIDTLQETAMPTNEYEEESAEPSRVPKPETDSVFIKQFEQNKIYDLQINNRMEQQMSFDYDILLYPPVKGTLTSKYDETKKHLGVDVVTTPNAKVFAMLDGTIILSTWTLEEGYVIQIQHNNNLISTYKHNAILLKEVGDKVRIGEPVAMVGNSGELSSGPHLHFEIWYNGTTLNPEEYIKFD